MLLLVFLTSTRNISHEVLDLAHISKPKHFKELFHPNHVSRWSKLIHETIQVTGIFQEMSVENQAWVEVHERLSKHCPVYSKLRLLLSSTDVDISDFTEDIRIELYGNSLHIFGLFNPLFSPACLSILAHSASLCPFVLSVDIGEDFSFVNADGTASVQDDRIGNRPYHDAGLDGAGQICGVADSGVNDLSCFFADDSGVYETSSTSRSWGVESRRRKIIQYVSYADSVDDEGGHGTHTCGTLAGSSISFFQEEKGVAYRAKIAFFDIGIAVCPSHFLTFPLGFSMSTLPIVIPRLHAVLFPTAYTAGARVHSNSWAGGLSSYAVYSQEIDKYLHENPDFAIILAAGNRGQFGLGSVGSPANSKNAICVGSIQLRSTFDDSLAASGPVVSMTSSLGPTLDGRFKPDILALGEGVMSAYSSSVEDQYQAQHMKYTLWSRQGLDKFWNSLTSCSVHEKSGTSMATPLIAGSALLIRQYFMDQMFWASICGKMKVNKDQIWCKSFEPTGYLLKALILHGGKAVSSRLQPDLSTLSSLQSPPDSFQGYGAFGLHHILPLQNGLGLDPMLDLVVFDRLEIQELSLLRFNLTFPSCNATLPLKITLSWFDPPSLIGWMSHLLIHDIDIALISPSEDHVYWGNNASYGDHTNPNEQIYVFHPKCSFDFCTFSLLLRAHSFPFKKFEGPENTSMQAAQAIALVITTNALVLGPYAELMDDWPLPIVAQEPLPAVAVESFGHKHAVSHLTEPFHSSHDFSVSVDFFSVPLEVSPRGGEFSHNVVTIARFENKIGLALSLCAANFLRIFIGRDHTPVISIIDTSCPIASSTAAWIRCLSIDSDCR